jgi:acetoin utilization protein AcuB
MSPWAAARSLKFLHDMSRPRPVEYYMTRGVHAVRSSESLRTAHEVMRSYQIRHLPVIDNGLVVGVVSLRDLILVEGLPGVDACQLKVADAMTHLPYVVSPDTDVREVMKEMQRRRLGSAIVVKHGALVGIFTTVDALRAFTQTLEAWDAASLLP